MKTLILLASAAGALAKPSCTPPCMMHIPGLLLGGSAPGAGRDLLCSCYQPREPSCPGKPEHALTDCSCPRECDMNDPADVAYVIGAAARGKAPILGNKE